MTTCGWCNRHYQQWRSQCDACGGPMPPPTGMELGAPPPDAPRTLPKNFAIRVLWSRNLAAIGGTMLLVVGAMMMIPMLANRLWLPALFPGLFVLGAFSLLKYGLSQGSSKLRAFRIGVAAKGWVASVGLDSTQSMNGKHPWKLTYHFAVNDQVREGTWVSFDSTFARYRANQPLWVLYLSEDPETSTLYPPVA